MQESYKEFLRLSEAARRAITDQVEAKANEALKRLGQRFFAEPEQIPKTPDGP